jgi:hypothetical protein
MEGLFWPQVVSYFEHVSHSKPSEFQTLIDHLVAKEACEWKSEVGIITLKPLASGFFGSVWKVSTFLSDFKN